MFLKRCRFFASLIAILIFFQNCDYSNSLGDPENSIKSNSFCPELSQSPLNICENSDMLAPIFDSNGCGIEYACKRPQCPLLSQPEPSFCSGGQIETLYDTEGCPSGFSCQ